MLQETAQSAKYAGRLKVGDKTMSWLPGLTVPMIDAGGSLSLDHGVLERFQAQPRAAQGPHGSVL